jgi:hypothetical protein
MKKTYQTPETITMSIHSEYNLLAGSGGLGPNATVGNSYNANDVNYSRGGSDFWDDEE